MNCAVNECGGNLTVFHFGESESAVESCVESCGSFTLVNFRTVRGNKATDLDGHDNLYVHCVSKERLELLREGMSNF